MVGLRHGFVTKFNDNDYQLQTGDKIKSYHINMLKKYIEMDSYKIGGLLDLVEPDTDISVVDDLLHVKVEGDTVVLVQTC